MKQLARVAALLVLIILAVLLLAGCGKETPTPVPVPPPTAMPEESTEQLDQLLVEAVEKGDPAAVERVLKKGANPMAMTPLGPLPTLAAFNGNPDIIGSLGKFGANFNALDSNGLAPIHIASNLGHLGAVSQMIDLGVDPNSLGGASFATPPLFNAIEVGNMDMANLLISNGANPNLPALGGATPLISAVDFGNMDMANLLVTSGADPNILGAGTTPLMSAIDMGNLDMSNMLLANGADPNLFGGGMTPLISAVDMGNLDMANLLIDNGAMLDLPGLDGFTPLHFAAINDDFEMFGLLLDSGADFGILNNAGQMPFELGQFPSMSGSDLSEMFPGLDTSSLNELFPGLGNP